MLIYFKTTQQNFNLHCHRLNENKNEFRIIWRDANIHKSEGSIKTSFRFLIIDLSSKIRQRQLKFKK